MKDDIEKAVTEFLFDTLRQSFEVKKVSFTEAHFSGGCVRDPETGLGFSSFYTPEFSVKLEDADAITVEVKSRINDLVQAIRDSGVKTGDGLSILDVPCVSALSPATDQLTLRIWLDCARQEKPLS